MPGIGEPALAARDTALTIMTTSLEMLQIKPFGSKRYPSDLVCHLYIPSAFRCANELSTDNNTHDYYYMTVM